MIIVPGNTISIVGCNTTWAVIGCFVFAVPPPPQNLRVVNVSDTSIWIRWDAPVPTNGFLNQYRITYSRATDDLDFSIVVNKADGTLKRLSGLTPYTQYSIKVRGDKGMRVLGTGGQNCWV